MSDYVVYKEHQFRVGMPVMHMDNTREFVQVFLNISDGTVAEICQRLNWMCEHEGINAHYGYEALL